MAEIYDIKLDADFDLLIDGDFSVQESTEQHQQCILLAEPSSFMQNKAVGVGIMSYLNNDESLESLKKEIQKQFEFDGMTISELTITSISNIKVTAQYGN